VPPSPLSDAVPRADTAKEPLNFPTTLLVLAGLQSVRARTRGLMLHCGLAAVNSALSVGTNQITSPVPSAS
jgi:hypothetical protein